MHRIPPGLFTCLHGIVPSEGDVITKLFFR